MVKVPLWPLELVTTTFTAPAACAGVVAVIEVVLTTLTFVAEVPPKVTVAPAAKLVPVMVTESLTPSPASDAEGATRLVILEVEGLRDDQEAVGEIAL